MWQKEKRKLKIFCENINSLSPYDKENKYFYEYTVGLPRQCKLFCEDTECYTEYSKINKYWARHDFRNANAQLQRYT